MRNRILILSGLFLWLQAMPLWSQESAGCGLLSVAQLSSLVKQKVLLQTSQVPGRCLFEWNKADAEAIVKQNQARLRASMRRGSPPYQPISPQARIALEIYREYASPAEARAGLQALGGGVKAEGFGSPDPLQGQTFQLLKDSKPPAAWNARNQTLLLQLGTRVFRLQVEVEEQSEKNRELALKLAPLIQVQP